MRRLRVRPATQTGVIAAPAGVNVVDPASALPPSDALLIRNMLRSEYGLRSRSGYREHVTGIGSQVRSVLSFQGSKGDESEDRLFACASAGVYDATTSTATPSQVYAFPTVNASSGWTSSTGFTTVAGGHWLLLADEANGYITYDESTHTWTKRVAGGGAGQVSSSTSDALDPADIVFVTVWKHRVWVVKRNTATAYYFATDSMFGQATPFYFGGQFPHGGYLVGLWSWTGDGGVGIDDHLVAISSSGDVAIYKGYDPADPSKFEIVGVWYVGAVPAGRRVAVPYGGDLLILSSLGVMPISRLVAGAAVDTLDAYASRKIAPVLGRTLSERASSLGWAIGIHPEDRSLVITLPATSGQADEQWVMALSAQGWAHHDGVPMTCIAPWKRKLYLGDDAGRVLINDGDVDNLQLADSSTATAIEWSLLTGFQNLGSASFKRAQMARPSFITDGTVPQFSVAARFDEDLTEPSSVSYTATAGAGVWGDPWGFLWGSGRGTAGEWRGLAGMGHSMAVALSGASKARTTLTGITVQWDEGGAT